MADQEPFDLRLEGETFFNALTSAANKAGQTVYNRAYASIQASAILSEANNDLTEEQKAAAKKHMEMRAVQFQLVIVDTLQEFVEVFFKELRGLAEPSTAQAPESPGTPPVQERTEPSWKKLHEMIGFKVE